MGGRGKAQRLPVTLSSAPGCRGCNDYDVENRPVSQFGVSLTAWINRGIRPNPQDPLNRIVRPSAHPLELVDGFALLD